MYTYETLDNIDTQTLHHAFLEAFSDYQVNINLSLEAFQKMLVRRGYALEISIGAFKEPGHELVGFILNGLRKWNGARTAYDLGTGVTPLHRQQGISSRMFQSVREELKRNQVEQYLLEVLQNNEAAFELYKKQGLSITRNFSFHKLEQSRYHAKELTYANEYLTEVDSDTWEQLQMFWDFSPSWQNSIDSIRAVQKQFVYAVVRLEKKIIGYGIVDPVTGDVPQIAVLPEYRRKGIATSIVGALMNHSKGRQLRVINVDNACEGMILFLENVGFETIGHQYEMMLTLDRNGKK
ncbi:GNAT family N-acetyltransferase [Paenibacillus sp. PDC88]|uniref:GNAT family N-acetyltransferase n=1 Tax=Paenibacillus sp. PDC88 TaxID=1884375 RepID=UPI000899C6DB|nr:GNAT family N-acetyltransferase [Paenibacillus sp. PDC88]SDX43406.1 Acetyltransferase (GNAT) domain-containing protein [Paenibacillus sp. PDC88]